VVIGLRAYNAEADRQTAALKEMAHRMFLALQNDRGQFQKDYARIVGELQLLAQDLENRKDELKSQQMLLEKNKALISARTADLKTLGDELENARQQTKTTLAEVAKEQKLLFTAEQQVGKRIEDNQALEQQIRSAEKINK
jgi:hypothetical protein